MNKKKLCLIFLINIIKKNEKLNYESGPAYESFPEKNNKNNNNKFPIFTKGIHNNIKIQIDQIKDLLNEEKTLSLSKKISSSSLRKIKVLIKEHNLINIKCEKLKIIPTTERFLILSVGSNLITNNNKLLSVLNPNEGIVKKTKKKKFRSKLFRVDLIKTSSEDSNSLVGESNNSDDHSTNSDHKNSIISGSMELKNGEKIEFSDNEYKIFEEVEELEDDDEDEDNFNDSEEVINSIGHTDNISSSSLSEKEKKF